MSQETKTSITHSLAENIFQQTGVKASRCYQCGKCSAGCPMNIEMDFPPSVIMRLLQTNLPEDESDILKSAAIWYCLTCEMCIARCPMEVDIPKVMDYLRQESIKQKLPNRKAAEIIAFHRAFLKSIELTGRLYEVGVIAAYKTKTLNLFQDLSLAPVMLLKGKLKFIPEKVKNIKNIKAIFQQTFHRKSEFESLRTGKA